MNTLTLNSADGRGASMHTSRISNFYILFRCFTTYVISTTHYEDFDSRPEFTDFNNFNDVISLKYSNRSSSNNIILDGHINTSPISPPTPSTPGVVSSHTPTHKINMHTYTHTILLILSKLLSITFPVLFSSPHAGLSLGLQQQATTSQSLVW